MLAYGGSMRRLVPALACLALLTACDSGESIDPEADEDLIQDAVLTIDDLPDGFVEAEVDDDDDDSDNECNEDVLEIDPDDLDDNETAKSDDVQFDSEDGAVSLRAEITAFRSTELPERVVEAIRDENDDYIDCLEDGITEEIGDDGEVTGIDVVDSPIDDGGALELTVEVPNGEATLELVLQQHAVLVDRFGISLQATFAGGEVDEDLVEDALDAMIERLEEGAEA
jgi:hypothetical protein